jgi:hypothetical protein
MQLVDFFSETLNEDNEDVGKNERSPTSLRRFGARLHMTNLWIGNTVALLYLLGVNYTYGEVRTWVHSLSEAQSNPPPTRPLRIRIKQEQREVDVKRKWLCAVINTKLNLLIEDNMFSRHGINLTVTSLHRLIKKNDVAETELLVSAGAV